MTECPCPGCEHHRTRPGGRVLHKRVNQPGTDRAAVGVVVGHADDGRLLARFPEPLRTLVLDDEDAHLLPPADVVAGDLNASDVGREIRVGVAGVLITVSHHDGGTTLQLQAGKYRYDLTVPSDEPVAYR